MSAFRKRGSVLVVLYYVGSFHVLFGYNVSREAQHDLSLNRKWTIQNSNGSLSLPAEVPGCVHSALLKQGFIKDLYFRFNDVAYRWIALDNWTYTTTFSASTELRTKQRVQMVFEGVDTVASISLNGVVVGKTDNMFRRYDFSVGQLLREGENVVKVSLLSPVVYASERSQAHSSYNVPPDCPPPVQKGECHVNFIRKAQSSFSWDWGPSFPTLGLWKGVRLEAFDVLRLIHLSTVPVYNSSLSQWVVKVDVLVVAVEETKVQVNLSLMELSSEQTFTVVFPSGKSKNTLILHVNTSNQVKLWWPSGHGEQHSYHLSVRGTMLEGTAVLRTDTQVYFRTVELVQEPIAGSPGLSFYFRVNKKPIFLKGSNWIPAHALQDLVSPADVRNLLQSSVDANMNALRVWGGGVYEQDLFYSLCDEMGIMIWQDFMFACAMYPTEPDFIETVREEVGQQVRRLKSHPSVIVWSGNNENEAALATDWFGIPVAQQPRYHRDYVTLYVDNIRAIVQKEDGSRPFLVSSPTNGAESQQEGWVAHDPYDVHYGDTHYYSYSHDCWDWTALPRTRFASEYGFQSWPSFSTLQKVSVSEDWSYGSNFSSHRQHHQSGNQQMLQQAGLHYQLPASADPLKRYRDTLYITQVMQAQCVKVQTEFYRRSQSEVIEGKGHTMGALYWQLNDIWQGPSWSSIGRYCYRMSWSSIGRYCYRMSWSSIGRYCYRMSWSSIGRYCYRMSWSSIGRYCYRMSWSSIGRYCYRMSWSSIGRYCYRMSWSSIGRYCYRMSWSSIGRYCYRMSWSSIGRYCYRMSWSSIGRYCYRMSWSSIGRYCYRMSWSSIGRYCYRMSWSSIGRYCYRMSWSSIGRYCYRMSWSSIGRYCYRMSWSSIGRYCYRMSWSSIGRYCYRMSWRAR
ncbi:beta-mannosidase isoform 1-T1 [Salvelinus alpinus]